MNEYRIIKQTTIQAKIYPTHYKNYATKLYILL